MHSKIFLFLTVFISINFAQTWQWTGRTHGELEWTTIETDHFRIHHHQGIKSIAVEGASLAEQFRPILLKQMELEDIPTIDIIFTTEDEIMNGFAMWTYTTFIWVDQNDAAIWLEDEKWLYQVLAHELQHIIFFHRIKTWIPEPWSFLISQIPGWVVEGLAEYETERWRPYRADISHKFHVLKNKMDEMDPHHDGYSKLLYWSDRFGDSTIVKVLSERNKFGMFRFKDAFKKHTSISVEQFNEDWRRHMNTYYYGYRSQKETIEDLGKVVSLPINNLSGFTFHKDSSKIAISGKDDSKQGDLSLYILERDTTKENKRKIENEQSDANKNNGLGFIASLFSKSEKGKQKPIIIWDKKEIDFGTFHPEMNWSPDGQKLVYAKYHFGKNQSMVNDIKIYDLNEKTSFWLTNSKRATYPDWSPDGGKIVFAAHENSVANLFIMNPDGSNLKQITNYTYDTQIINPHFSPDGKSVLFAMADSNANLDLFVLKLDTGNVIRITKNPAADYKPIWHPDGEFVSYTSHADGTPNIHTVNIATGESEQISDVGDAVWTAQWSPLDSTLMATTLTDVDTVRIAKINPHRSITTKSLSLREQFTRWRTVKPRYPLKGINPRNEVNILASHDYTPRLGVKHVTSLILPLGSELVGATQWTDAMVRHIFIALGTVDLSKTSNHRFLLLYANAMNEPMWGIDFASYMDFKMKPYDRSKGGLFEENSSISLWTQFSFNFGESFSSNHTFSTRFKFTDRNAKVIKDMDVYSDEQVYLDSSEFRFMRPPMSGKEGLIRLAYTWLNRRPHNLNYFFPKQGFGMMINLDYSNSNWYGDFDYTKIIWDGFINILPHKKSPIVIFTRVKSVSISGTNPPSQDMPAITNDTPLYLGGKNFLGADEVVHLRGWNDWRFGNRMIFGTVEPRIKLGKFVFTGFTDFGNVWYSDAKMNDWIVTAGYEVRLDLFGFILAYGTAQEIKKWDDDIPQNYLRLSLVNPF